MYKNLNIPFNRKLEGFNLAEVKASIERQHQKAKEIAKMLETRTPLVIEHYTKQGRKYYNEELVEVHYELMKEGFEFDELRNAMIHFRFVEEGPIYSLRFPHFLTNIIMWEPLVKLGPDHINESVLVDAENISSGMIKSYIDNKIIIPFQKEVKNRTLNKVIHDMLFNLGRISDDFNPIMGMSINTETFIDLANRYPRFDEILHTKIPDDMQPSDIEEYINKLNEEQIAIIKNDPQDNLLKPIFLSGTGINEGQFKEFAVNSGLKPSFEGATMPVPVNSNFLMGLDSVKSLFIDAVGGRKSLVMNASVMGLSGYFARLIMLLASEVKLRKDDEECATLHPVMIQIKNEKILKKFKNRYYKLPWEREYKILKGNEKELIGQSVLFRSPTTCASHEGICRKCYGLLSHTNGDLESIGGFAATKNAEPLSQKILSSKHLLKTDSEKIEFNGIFDKFFTIRTNEVALDPEKDDAIENYSLVIFKDHIIEFEEVDESNIDSYTKVFYILDKRTGEMHEITEKDMKDLFITPTFKELIHETNKRKGRSKKKNGNNKYYEVPLVDIGFDEPIFLLEIHNSELTKPLYEIMELLDNKEKRAKAGIETIDDMVQRLVELYIDAGLPIDAVHGEVLIRSIIRSKHNILELPDFTRYDAMKDVNILTVKTALNNHPSLTVSLSFQAIARQLTNYLTFKKKDGSFMDPYFRERL